MSRPDELNEMRERGDAHGYRDGASWKFKEDEIRRIADEIKSGGRREDDMGNLSLGDDLELADEYGNEASDESILVSEEELGHSGESTSSTIIGKMGDKAKQNDSDLKLDSAGSSMAFLPDAGKGTDMKLVDGVDSDLTIASDIDLDSDVTLVPGGSADSDVSLIPTGKTDLELPAPGKSDVLTGTDMKLKSGLSGGTGGLGQRTS